ncbi:MAG: DUF5371 family protein [Candidatus Hadarchaeota archaeon]
MGRLIIVKTSLFEGDLEELKEKTGKSTNKDAIAMAIAHYNRCSNVKDKRERCIEKKETLDF